MKWLGNIIEIVGICAALAACGGNSESLLVGTWQQIGSETRHGNEPWVVPADAACRLDNVEDYSEDGSWTLYDGANQCGAGTGIVHGTFRLTASDTKVVYTYDGTPGEYESTVEDMSDTKLVLTMSTGDSAGTQVRNTYRRR